ncbi:CIC11C00000003035 [Sungouiella intermedia]|uniref:CIC11C00000003035 n=1 Tax=Sungouiella intermedia TaxID=45354 RepID=A0A1L0BQG0_9ASCO|nr:CIC11C00000003035 [[Candida] intermedia]
MNSRYSTAGSAHQRDIRTQLFSSPSPRLLNASTPARMSSPYDKAPQQSAKHNEAFLLSLESQNNEEVDLMSQKVNALKNLGVRMGSEINKSMKLNDDISNNFEKGKITLKNTYNRMVVMSKRAGILWRMWLVFFSLFFLACFYVWLF